ncbi:MAG: DUF504 domain-containing protein [Candidatus Woesearchaeota archaeon]
MITIKELINKIKWDKKENPDDYTLGYWDNMQKKLIMFPYKAIKEMSENFITVEIDSEEKEIPMHAVKIVKKKGEMIWKRQISND